MNKFLAWFKHWKYALGVILMLGVLLVIGALVSRYYQFRDHDADRGAMTVKTDIFGDQFTTVKYLKQGWKEKDSLWFYNMTQGSDVMPYDFFMVLEQKGSTALFRDNENINRYRYLPRKATVNNPDALPVGFVEDRYRGKSYVGFTCAACHTGQLNYKGTGIRIDGGPAGADMDSFIRDLAAAMFAARDDAAVRQRFVKSVIDRGSYDSEKEIIADLDKYARRIETYTVVNHSPTEYGYARLDAFGRIYNRVLEYVITGPELRQALSELVAEKTMSEAEFKAIVDDKVLSRILEGKDCDHIVERISNAIGAHRVELRDKLFNRPDAPVSYPFLWDIPQHDYVQWNGIVSNSGLGPVGRNTGEVIGVFGTLDWGPESSWSPFKRLTAYITGQGFFKKTYAGFESSINVRNLRRIERRLKSLESPLWPEEILPKLDQAGVERGEHLFDSYCSECHAEIKRDDPNRRVVAHMSSVRSVGTDPGMATNSVEYAGFSGMLRNLYVEAGDVGDILIDQKAPVAALLTKVTLSVVATPDPDAWPPQRVTDWIYDLGSAFFANEIKRSLKRGNYEPDTTEKPFASVLSYKGRSLNGIWATAPYLHNGSVPTMYDLLLPKKQAFDPAEGEYRPDTFMVGAREFDPEKMGLKSAGYDGFKFDTTLKGNSNAGHEYGARDRTLEKNGETVTEPALSRDQRMDLLEYLKTL